MKIFDFKSFLIVKVFTLRESIWKFYEAKNAKFFRLMMTFKSLHLADMCTMKKIKLPSRCVCVCVCEKLIINLGKRGKIDYRVVWMLEKSSAKIIQFSSSLTSRSTIICQNLISTITRLCCESLFLKRQTNHLS